jgi:hypothetical protein
VPSLAKGVPARFVSVGPAAVAKASSEGWRLCLRPNSNKSYKCQNMSQKYIVKLRQGLVCFSFLSPETGADRQTLNFLVRFYENHFSRNCPKST